MEIETLQIKRVTGNWDTHQDTPTQQGEPILIEGNVIPDVSYPIIVLGQKDKKISELVNTDRVFISKMAVDLLISDNNTSQVSDAAGTVKSVGVSNEVGTSTLFARADHQHTIERNTLESSLLKVNDTIYEPSCRRISMGTQDPNDPKNPITGRTGDIYIKYKEQDNG